MNSIRARRIVAAIAAVGVLGTGAYALADTTDRGAPDVPATAPVVAPPSDAPGRDSDTGQETVTTYFVRVLDGRLVLEAQAWSRPADAGAADPLRTALDEVFRGPQGAELTTLAPEGTRILTLEVVDGVAVVDVSEEVGRNPGVGAEGEWLFAQQLAQTARAAAGADGIRLSIEGQLVDELWGHVDWSVVITPDDDVLHVG